MQALAVDRRIKEEGFSWQRKEGQQTEDLAADHSSKLRVPGCMVEESDPFKVKEERLCFYLSPLVFASFVPLFQLST